MAISERGLACVLLVLLPALTARAAATLEAGEWSVTTAVNMPGATIAPVTVKHCVRAEDVKAPADVINQANEQMKQHQCRLSDQKTTASTLSYKLECSGQMKMQAVGNFSYGPGFYKGTLDMSMEGGMKLRSDISGKRVGPCK